MIQLIIARAGSQQWSRTAATHQETCHRYQHWRRREAKEKKKTVQGCLPIRAAGPHLQQQRLPLRSSGPSFFSFRPPSHSHVHFLACPLPLGEAMSVYFWQRLQRGATVKGMVVRLHRHKLSREGAFVSGTPTSQARLRVPRFRPKMTRRQSRGSGHGDGSAGSLTMHRHRRGRPTRRRNEGRAKTLRRWATMTSQEGQEPRPRPRWRHHGPIHPAAPHGTFQQQHQKKHERSGRILRIAQQGHGHGYLRLLISRARIQVRGTTARGTRNNARNRSREHQHFGGWMDGCVVVALQPAAYQAYQAGIFYPPTHRGPRPAAYVHLGL